MVTDEREEEGLSPSSSTLPSGQEAGQDLLLLESLSQLYHLPHIGDKGWKWGKVSPLIHIVTLQTSWGAAFPCSHTGSQLSHTPAINVSSTVRQQVRDRVSSPAVLPPGSALHDVQVKGGGSSPQPSNINMSLGDSPDQRHIPGFWW